MRLGLLMAEDGYTPQVSQWRTAPGYDSLGIKIGFDCFRAEFTLGSITDCASALRSLPTSLGRLSPEPERHP